ncbi:MAG: hypothetical protein FJ267_09795 [Planctomycetes bacterium]|nr:hypothetical protein [Planctomycetota bacterium]
MSEVLSRSEIDVLLAGLDTSARRDQAPQQSASLKEGRDADGRPDVWRLHDFQDPNRLSVETISLLQSLHAGLCQKVARRIERTLGVPSRVQTISLNQVRFDESLQQKGHIACLFYPEMDKAQISVGNRCAKPIAGCSGEDSGTRFEPSESGQSHEREAGNGHGIELSPQKLSTTASTRNSLPRLILWQSNLGYAITQRLLGDDIKQSKVGEPPILTEIENRLLSSFSRSILEELVTETLYQAFHNQASHDQSTPAFSDGGVWTISQSQSETGSCPLAKAPDLAATAYVSVSFELICDGARGLMHYWFPTSSVFTDRDSMNQRRVDREFTSDSLASLMNSESKNVTVQVVAKLANVSLQVSDLVDLAIGDIVLTDKVEMNTVSLDLAGQSLYQASIGTLTGKKAVRLVKAVPTGEK